MKRSIPLVAALLSAVSFPASTPEARNTAPSESGTRVIPQAITAVRRHVEALWARKGGGRISQGSYPRRTPAWTNARYRRAAAKKRNVVRNRRAHRG